MVRHEKEGRAHRYFPVVEPEEAGGAALGRIVDKIFLGSAEMAVARLVSDRQLDRAAVERRHLERVLGHRRPVAADGGPSDRQLGRLLPDERRRIGPAWRPRSAHVCHSPG